MMITYQNILEKFTGTLTNCTVISSARLPNFPMGKYHLFSIKTADCASREVCLFETHANITEPMSRSSDVSPVYGAEELSGKLADACYTLVERPETTVFIDKDVCYCLYQLRP